MWNVCTAWTNDSDVLSHVPIVTLYVIIMFKGHVSSYSEWTSTTLEYLPAYSDATLKLLPIHHSKPLNLEGVCVPLFYTHCWWLQVTL